MEYLLIIISVLCLLGSIVLIVADKKGKFVSTHAFLSELKDKQIIKRKEEMDKEVMSLLNYYSQKKEKVILDDKLYFIINNLRDLVYDRTMFSPSDYYEYYNSLSMYNIYSKTYAKKQTL